MRVCVHVCACENSNSDLNLKLEKSDRERERDNFKFDCIALYIFSVISLAGVPWCEHGVGVLGTMACFLRVVTWYRFVLLLCGMLLI